MLRKITIAIACLATIGCASLPQNRIEGSLIELGLSQGKASCAAREFQENLSRRDVNNLANFLGELTSSRTNGRGFNVLFEMDNEAVGNAAKEVLLSCALTR